MAEFQIVAKEIERLCKTYQDKCCTDECPLYLEDLCYAKAMSHIYEDDAGKLEDAVMSWAKEHPEPTYPTWEEWLVEQGILQSYYVGGTGKYVYTMSDFGCSPIQDDTAEKLGIQPKEN